MTINKQPKISIITVCYNERKDNIVLTFDSISSQSYKNTEWIVIDGGSKPETIEEITGYLGNIDKFVSEPDRGIYDAMNKGLSFVSGDFVIFMNVGDRFYSNETIERAVDCIIANPTYDCYYGDSIRVDNGNVEEINRAMPNLNRFWLYKEGICHQSIFSSRQLYERTGYFDINYRIMADWDWVHQSIAVAARWKHINLIVCYYDCNGISSNHIETQADFTSIQHARYGFWKRTCYTVVWKLIRRLRRWYVSNIYNRKNMPNA